MSKAYLGEFRRYWQPLLAASIGLGLGSSLSHYTLGLFGPPLIAEFGWTKADFALVGSLPLALLLLAPLAGRFTDRFGTRIAAIVGFSAMPLGFIAFSMMSGSLIEFFAIWVLQHMLGILTTSMVFCRVIVERFDAARGMALSLVMTAPPLVGAIAAPALGGFIDEHGWRAGYLALAGLTSTGGVLAVLLMGRDRSAPVAAPREAQPKPASMTARQLFALLRNPTLLLILSGMLLVNIPQVFASSQLKLVVMSTGTSSEVATWMMSLYAIGVIIGRFISGFALDRVKPHKVAIAMLGLPALGYFAFTLDIAAVSLLSLSMLIIGFAQGAEADIGAFLISRRLDIKNFSLLMSLLTAMVGAGSAVGSFVLSATLRSSDSYTPFLLVSAITTLIGAALFALTGSRRLTKSHPQDQQTGLIAEGGRSS